MKKLFLASTIKHPDSIEKLEKFSNGLKNKKVAYIPTAANGEIAFGKWKLGPSFKTFKKFGTDAELILLEDFKDKRVLDYLVNKDVIFIAGGLSGYLMYWMRRCEIDVHINEILKSGVMYVGISAGAMVCAKTLRTSDAYFPQIEVGASVIPGLGLVDFSFWPHYEEEQLNEIKKVWKGEDLYLVKDGEAITVVDDKIEVLGEKRILRKGQLIK